MSQTEPEEMRPSGRYGRRLHGYEEDENVDEEMW